MRRFGSFEGFFQKVSCKAGGPTQLSDVPFTLWRTSSVRKEEQNRVDLAVSWHFPLSTLPPSFNHRKLTFLLSFLVTGLFLLEQHGQPATPFTRLSTHARPMLFKKHFFPPSPRLLTAINRRGSQIKPYALAYKTNNKSQLLRLVCHVSLPDALGWSWNVLVCCCPGTER